MINPSNLTFVKPRFLLLFTTLPKKHKTAVRPLFTTVLPVFNLWCIFTETLFKKKLRDGAFNFYSLIKVQI